MDTFAENETPIQVLCLQETWFENSDNIDLGLFHIDNYHFVTKNRYASAHGGLAYYIHSNWNYKIKSDTVDSPYWEEMYIEIYDSTNPKCKFTVGNMYRPPHTATVQLTSFIDYFTDRLSLLNVRETTVVCGDFNINLLSINSNEHYNTFFADTLSSSFLPTITLPTQLSNNSSLIDNIFVNKHERLNFAGILNNEISDHQVIAVNMNLTLPPQKINYITVFSNSDQSKINFKNDFESKSVYDRLNHELDANPDENYSILETAISDSMNAHLEKKIVKFNRRKHKQDPWITYAILNSVNHKNRLYKRLMKINRDTPLFMTKKQEFNAYKNSLRKVINLAKNYYFSTQFQKNKGDGKKTWETLDNVLHRKTSKSSPDAIQINDKLSTDKTEMADSFNTYFSTICATSEIDNPNNVPSHEVYLNNPTEAEFNFEQIDNVTVLHYINKLKPSHSCGHDNISSNVLKIIAMEVSLCLTLIINQVLSTGQFQKNLKTAKVIPIHKTGEKSLMKNYRPISILPVVSKIIENVMHTQLTDYFTLNKLFTSQQYGYRENRSTELAALELMDRNLDNMNRNLTPVNVYIDLSKAFDCLDHNILLSKLKFYGLNDNAIKLLKNYLSDRNQYVQLGNTKSQLHGISRGIPQGSVMGPLLFNIVINDLNAATKKFDLIMYADDTTLISTLETFGNTNRPTEIENNISDEISKITTWLHSNKLKLNASKSKFMIFFKHPKIIPKLNIWANGNQIDEVQEFNFLGITIDQNITWTPHIRKISIKISRVIGVLRKLKYIFLQHILRLIYNSLIHPHLIYGLNLWGFKHKRITILQKKAIRILAFRPYISHSTSAFKELKIPMLKDLYTIQLYKIYYKNIHNILPVYFQRFLPNYKYHCTCTHLSSIH